LPGGSQSEPSAKGRANLAKKETERSSIRHFGKEKGKKNSMPKEKNSLVPEDLLAEAQATIRKNPRKKNYLELSLSLFSFSYAFTKNVWKESMDLRK